MKSRFVVEIRGYLPHETDFGKLIAERPDLQDPAVAAIIDSAFEAFENASGLKSCAIAIVGHSDREDTPGLAEGERRAAELQASRDRADSASAWLLDKVNEMALGAGMALEADWKGVASVAVETVGVGASDLAHPPVSEQDRLNNRRIRFLVSGNNVAAVEDRDGDDTTFAPAP